MLPTRRLYILTITFAINALKGVPYLEWQLVYPGITVTSTSSTVTNSRMCCFGAPYFRVSIPAGHSTLMPTTRD